MNSRFRRIALVFSLLLLPGALPAAKSVALPPPNTPLAPAPSGGGFLQFLLPKSFQTNPKLDMTVYTEMTAEGRKLPEVTPQHPSYYELDCAGFHPMGELSASHQLPTQDEMQQLLTRVLSARGYQPATPPTQLPDLLLVYTWGTHNRLSQLDDEDSPQDPEALRRNITGRALLVGGQKFADELNKVMDESQRYADSAQAASRLPGYTPLVTTISPVEIFEQKNPKNQFLLEQTLDDCYYVVASAYDYRAAAAGTKKLLWRTRMTVNAQGVAMKQAMPTVVISAGPLFGHETPEPEIINRRVVPDGTIEIGTPMVLPGPVPPAPPPAKK